MRWQKGGRHEDGVGVGVEGDSEDVGEDGGGDEEPSKLTEEKVGTSSFSIVITDSAGGEGRSWRGGREGGSFSRALVAASARAAWCAAARWLRRALARGPLRRWRRPVGEDGEEDTMGGAAVVPISSWILVFPPAVATDKVACPPAFSILWKTSSKRVSSFHIFASGSEV